MDLLMLTNKSGGSITLKEYLSQVISSIGIRYVKNNKLKSNPVNLILNHWT
jgi:hypothetical protein